MSSGKLPDWCLPEWERLAKIPQVRMRLGFTAFAYVMQSRCHPLQRSFEMQEMFNLVQGNKPRVVVEIGTSRGGGVYHWADNVECVDRIAGVDVNGQPYAPVFREMFPSIDWHFHHGSSLERDWLDGLIAWLGGDKIDVLFIDGCKTAFRTDFDNHLSLMSPSGIVFMHDIQSTAAAAWKQLEERSPWDTCRLIDTSESLAAMQRMRRGEEATAYEKWLRSYRGRSAGVGVVFLGAGRCAPIPSA